MMFSLRNAFIIVHKNTEYARNIQTNLVARYFHEKHRQFNANDGQFLKYHKIFSMKLFDVLRLQMSNIISSKNQQFHFFSTWNCLFHSLQFREQFANAIQSDCTTTTNHLNRSEKHQAILFWHFYWL